MTREECRNLKKGDYLHRVGMPALYRIIKTDYGRTPDGKRYKIFTVQDVDDPNRRFSLFPDYSKMSFVDSFRRVRKYKKLAYTE